MQILKGIGVSPGVSIAPSVVLDAEDVVIRKRQVDADEVEAEVGRLDDAVGKAREELAALSASVADEHGKDVAGIFDFHIGLLGDPKLVKDVSEAVRAEQFSAEYATSQTMRRLAKRFERMPDEYLAARAKDVYDVERRVLRHLIGERQESLGRLERDVVVVAPDLLPSQTAALDRQRVLGFATDAGGRTSHTAIVARAMNIPAVVGLGDATSAITGGDVVVIDGTNGLIVIDPTDEQLIEYRERAVRRAAQTADLDRLRDLPAETQDGQRVEMLANIEFPSEIDDVLARGAGGIGLYRTEFLYLASDHEPTEEEHFAAYADAVRRLEGRPLVIRTLDLGADKYADETRSSTDVPSETRRRYEGRPQERNPFLGDRSIRLCLHDLPMFKRQLRAILRASAATKNADVRIMFPMITTIMELRQAKMVLHDVEEELEDEDLPFRRNIPIGMMIEVPSAALMAPQFAREVDFFSIGTNDLIQYTLAVDRTNERVAGLFNPAHPAVLSLIRGVIRAGKRAEIGVSVCGEMAGEPLYTLLLLGLGLSTFSMNGPDVPVVKRVIRHTTAKHARDVGRRVMSFDSERQVVHYLQEEMRRLLPDDDA
ncbi:MAG: phosphoenolpyruvate--protein phosphotransferase [Planctomycetota bacterium]